MQSLNAYKVELHTSPSSVLTGNTANNRHLNAAINWLKRAHDKSTDDGVSYGYYLRGRPNTSSQFGWRNSYVETSGYIVPTFFDIAQKFQDDDAKSRAKKIGCWLLSVQNEDGSFSNVNYHEKNGIVFDTGQVLLGLTRAWQETQDQRFYEAAERACLWLSGIMDTDGAWRRNTHNHSVHSYNSRVAWAMLDFAQHKHNPSITHAAQTNLEWVLTQQLDNGMFDNCAFKHDAAPFTHTIAYAIRGLFESGLILKDNSLIIAAKLASKTVMSHLKDDGFLPSRIGIDNTSMGRSCCLTGNCQMAIIWLKMGRYLNDPSMIEAAHSALAYVLNIQNLDTKNENINGGVKGSHPIWGRYASFAYPNWATKFLVDALLLIEPEG